MLGKETTQGKGGWFPSIIGPNEVYARNRSGEEDVTPTPYYDAKTMPKFRRNPAPGDAEDEELISKGSDTGNPKRSY